MQYIFINNAIPYLGNSRLLSSVASIPQCLHDLQTQQFVAEFYRSLQSVKCQQERNNQSKLETLTFVLVFISLLSSIKNLTSAKYPPDAAECIGRYPI